MSQQTTFLSLGCLTKRTRADRLMDEMSRVVPWAALAEIVAPHYQPAAVGRPLTDLALLRLHCLQLWYNLSDPGLEDAVHDRLSFQGFLALDPLNPKVPDETTVLHFRRLLEQHTLAEAIFAPINASLAAQGLLVKKTGTVVDATILAAPSNTKNQTGQQAGLIYFLHDKAHCGQPLSSGSTTATGRSPASAPRSNFPSASLWPRDRPLPRPRPAPPALRPLQSLASAQNPARRRLNHAGSEENRPNSSRRFTLHAAFPQSILPRSAKKILAASHARFSGEFSRSS